MYLVKRPDSTPVQNITRAQIPGRAYQAHQSAAQVQVQFGQVQV